MASKNEIKSSGEPSTSAQNPSQIEINQLNDRIEIFKWIFIFLHGIGILFIIFVFGYLALAVSGDRPRLGAFYIIVAIVGTIIQILFMIGFYRESQWTIIIHLVFSVIIVILNFAIGLMAVKEGSSFGGLIAQLFVGLGFCYMASYLLKLIQHRDSMRKQPQQSELYFTTV